MDAPFLAELFAVLIFAVCLMHAWNHRGRRMAQQWFLIGYLFSLLLISLLVVVGQIAYNPAMLAIGAAPSLTIMVFPGVFYLALTFAQLFADPQDLRGTAYVILLLTPVLMLPLDVTAVQLHWWNFPTGSESFLNGVPFYLPFAWGITGAAFFLMIGRIRQIRFRGSGQLFAMIVAAPLLSGVMLLVIGLVQVLVFSLGSLGGDVALYAALVVLYVALPLALVFNVPRLRADIPVSSRRSPSK